MGVDITCYVELCDDNGWHIAPVKVENKYAYNDSDKWTWAQPWHGRDYELFDILTDGHINIDSPRGLPNDVSDEVKAERDRFRDEGLDFGLSISCDSAYNDTYFTLFELELALKNRKKFPKHYKYKDAFGNKIKEEGPHRSLKGFVTAISNFADLCGYYDSTDVRVILWLDR
jgi:hypothetical protein